MQTFIDIDGGDSPFADALPDKGCQKLFMFWTSLQMQLKKAKQRLGERASKVKWILSDIYRI